MVKSNPQNTLFIKAGPATGFLYDVTKFDGYDIFSPYKSANLFKRIVREICFRVPFLPKKLWYNRDITKKIYHYILVYDTLITEDFLEWLSENFKEAQLNFLYGNKVGFARHIMPYCIPPTYRIWSYDRADCEKYNLRMNISVYHDLFVRPLKTPKYDVLFVGRDKGRLSYLLEIEKKLREMGLVPKFIIVKNTRFSLKKSVYQDKISYDELLDLITETRSILHITMPGQDGLTMRDMESLFFGVKLLTNNKNIIKADFYNPNNVFVLDKNNLQGLDEFLRIPYHPVDRMILKKRSFKSLVEMVTSND